MIQGVDDHSDLIVVDGQNDNMPPKRDGRRGRGAGILLGLAVGFVVAGIFATSAQEPSESETTLGTTSTTLEEVSPTAGIGEVIPGFPDGLNVLVSPGGGRAFEVVTWPFGRSAIRRSIPLGDRTTLGNARFDAGGHYLAALVDDGNGGESLMAGRINSFGVIDGQVSGFAWHDGTAADLAWTAADGGVVSLLVSEDGGSAEPRVVVEDLGFEAVVTAFGDWGFAISPPATAGLFDILDDPATLILGPGGEQLANLPGLVLDSHPSGIIFVDDFVGTKALILEVSDRELIQGTLSLARPPAGVALSPDGTHLAASGLQGMEIIELGSGSQIAEYPVRIGNGPATWSSDGRFLVVPGFRGILVVDTESGEIHTVLENDGTRAAAPAPIGGG